MNSSIHCPIPNLSSFEADPVNNLTPLIDHLRANIPRVCCASCVSPVKINNTYQPTPLTEKNMNR